MSYLTPSQIQEQRKLAIWAKGRVIENYDPAVWRHDDKGSVMRYSDYGNRSSEFGWEFDHYPVAAALGGDDSLSNLRPLNWKNNAKHGALLSGLLR